MKNEKNSSETGDQGSSANNDESLSQKPSPTAVQSTLPSATPRHDDEGSLQPCPTQHGTTEVEEFTAAGPLVTTDFTQNTERSERTPLIPTMTAHIVTDTTESPIPKQQSEKSHSFKNSVKRSGKKARRKNTLSTRAFFPPHLIGAHMSQRRVRRVKTSTDERRPPSSDGSASTKPDKSSRIPSSGGAQCEQSGTNSKRSRSGSKKKKKKERKRRKTESTADRDARFFHRVEKYKNRKVEMDCSCPITRCEGCEKGIKRVGGCLQTSGRACWVVCLPPLPNLILNKAAFWPPSREYYFFQQTKEGKEAEVMKRKEGKKKWKDKTKVTLRKATKSSVGQQWEFGFEHRCYRPLSPSRVECFVIETLKHHYIACVMVRTPSKQPRYTLLYSHPNGSDLSDHMNGVPSVYEIAKFLDCDIVIYDYSGYGISSGQSNEKNLYADIQGVYQHLTTVRKIDPAKIVIYGYSIGTAAAIALLAESQPPVAGAILLAPLTSMLRVLLWKRACFNKPFARRKPCVDKFRSIEKIHLVGVPILVCHGQDDIVVPIEHGMAVHEKAPLKVPPLWISEAGHNNLENCKELWARIRHYLYNELPSSRTPPTSTPLLVTPLGGSPSPTKGTTVIHL